MLLSDFAESSKFSDAGVRENDVKCPFRFDCLIKTIEIGQSGNVSLNTGDATADRLHGRVELLLTAASNEDICTLSYEELCGSQAYSSCATGDDCYFSLKLFTFGHGM